MPEPELISSSFLGTANIWKTDCVELELASLWCQLLDIIRLRFAFFHVCFFLTLRIASTLPPVVPNVNHHIGNYPSLTAPAYSNVQLQSTTHPIGSLHCTSACGEAAQEALSPEAGVDSELTRRRLGKDSGTMCDVKGLVPSWPEAQPLEVLPPDSLCLTQNVFHPGCSASGCLALSDQMKRIQSFIELPTLCQDDLPEQITLMSAECLPFFQWLFTKICEHAVVWSSIFGCLFDRLIVFQVPLGSIDRLLDVGVSFE